MFFHYPQPIPPPLCNCCLFSVSFHVPSGHLYIFFRKISVQYLFIFKPMWIFCYWVLWVLYSFLMYNPLSDIWFTVIFSHSVCCFFISLLIFFPVQKLYSLMSSHLFILLLLFLLLLSGSKRYFQDLCQRAYHLSFPLKNSLVSHLIFRVFSPYRANFCLCVR